uniref:Uncharacterized protein n=1 Tax=Sinocyclocheilus anshuiensis TaxID=1608454 RepID=A0A671KL60_9TELE
MERIVQKRQRKAALKSERKYQVVTQQPFSLDHTPRITVRMRSHRVPCGQNTKFTLNVQSKPDADIQWFHNGQQIQESSKYQFTNMSGVLSLQINDCQEEDSGTYRVVCTNSKGEASDYGTLDVSGGAFTTYSSRRRDEEAPTPFVPDITKTDCYHSTTIRASSASRTHLEIKETKTKLTERCEVSIKESETTSEVSVKKVKATLSAKILTKPQSLTVSEGDSARFVCDIDGEPAPSVTWMHEGRTIVSSHRFHVSTTQYKSTFEISSVVYSDEGSYTVVVENSEGKQEARFTLTIHKQIIKEEGIPTQVKPPEPSVTSPVLTVACAFSGEPAPRIEWSRGGKKLPGEEESSRFHIETTEDLTTLIITGVKESQEAKLEIKEVTKSDSGQYRCVASNKHGEIECSTDLNVNEKKDSGPEVAVFECEIKINYPEITLSWYKDTQKLETSDKYDIKLVGDRQILKIKNCQTSDQGNYRVVCGPHISSARLIVLGKSILKTLYSVSLAWEEPESDGGSKILAYVVERRDVKRKTWTMATDRADIPEYCVVQAKNKFGELCFSLFLSFLVRGENKVIVGVVNRFGATVSWEPPLFDGGSEITSYIIELRDRTSVKWEPAMVVKAEDHTATLNDVVENKEYIFRVRAENKAGIGQPSAATDPVKIMDPIVGPTMDLSGFKNGLEVIVPNALVIRVPITGYPVPKPKWTFGDKEFTAGDRVSMVTRPTYTELVVAPSVRPDKGTYTLQLENDVTTVSGEIEVNVIGMHIFFLLCSPTTLLFLRSN